MKKILIRALGLLMSFAGLVLLAHYFIHQQMPANLKIHNFWGIHIFFFVFTSTAIAGMLYVQHLQKEKMGMAFLAASMFKIFGSVLFLWPVLKSEFMDKKLYVMHFGAVFFIYLAYEVLLLIKEVNR